jgi:hypothetical protein
MYEIIHNKQQPSLSILSYILQINSDCDSSMEVKKCGSFYNRYTDCDDILVSILVFVIRSRNL